jgi:hypothetical protein
MGLQVYRQMSIERAAAVHTIMGYGAFGCDARCSRTSENKVLKRNVLRGERRKRPHEQTKQPTAGWEVLHNNKLCLHASSYVLNR